MDQFKFDHKDVKAFGILGVSVGLKWKKIQDKFKTLVKKFHPDMNSGNKKFEDKHKVITLAYTQLKNTYREKNDTKYWWSETDKKFIDKSCPITGEKTSNCEKALGPFLSGLKARLAATMLPAPLFFP